MLVPKSFTIIIHINKSKCSFKKKITALHKLKKTDDFDWKIPCSCEGHVNIVNSMSCEDYYVNIV